MKILDYDQLAVEYGPHRQVHPGVLHALYSRMDKEHTVLEVGCGTGNYIIALAVMTGCRAWGVDPSAEMLARAQQQLDDTLNADVHLCQGRAEHLDLSDAPFDLVFGVDVIHHIQDRAAYLRRAYSLLKPGGLICTATDSEWIIRHREPLATYWPETIAVELKRYPRIEQLERLYRNAGLTDLERQEVEHSMTLTDGQAYRDKAFSALHLIPDSAYTRGLACLEQDLCSGPVPWVSRYTLLWGTRA